MAAPEDRPASASSSEQGLRTSSSQGRLETLQLSIRIRTSRLEFGSSFRTDESSSTSGCHESRPSWVSICNIVDSRSPFGMALARTNPDSGRSTSVIDSTATTLELLPSDSIRASAVCPRPSNTTSESATRNRRAATCRASSDDNGIEPGRASSSIQTQGSLMAWRPPSFQCSRRRRNGPASSQFRNSRPTPEAAHDADV